MSSYNIEQSDADKTNACSVTEQANVFIARQPILNKHKHLFGYELLFRNGPENFFNCDDPEYATRKMVDNTVSVFEFKELIGGKKAFVNITRELLMQQFYEVLPWGETVVELLENIEPDKEVFDACKEMRSAGYLLALDDFVFKPEYKALIGIADIIKIDLLETDMPSSQWIINKFKRPDLSFLAEKVESYKDFKQSVNAGFSFFQGYFFCKPEIVKGYNVPAYKQNYLQFLQEVNRSNIDFNRLERVIKSEPSLAIKLLRYLNSASLGVRHKIKSVRQSLVMLGERPLRKWASMVATTCIGKDKPPELIKTCLIRGQFCEFIASEVGLDDRKLEFFLMGLLSAIDALMDYPMSELIESLPVTGDAKSSLLKENNSISKILKLSVACERGRWEEIEQLTTELGLDEQRIAVIQRTAMHWADEVLEI